MKKVFLLLLLFPLQLFSQNFSPTEIARWQQQAKQVTIIRDNWGVPHIYGKTDADAVFGLLYAQCEDNFKRVEENNLEMLGRLSEINGKAGLYEDLQMRLIYDSSAAIKDYETSPAWFKKLLDAAASGVNYFLFKHREVKPEVLNRFEPWFALMRTDGSISATQTGGLTLKDMSGFYLVNDAATSFYEKQVPSYDQDPTGSNGFAIAPSRTASKNTLLYINPHVTFYFRDEMQMVSDEGLNAYGAVTWGTFFIYQGFNEHCGWMHTSSYADVADLFKERTEKKGNSVFYSYDGKWLPVQSKQIIIAYKQDDNIHRQSFTTYTTIHGPVMGSRNGEWLSLRENNRSLDALLQSWLRTKANGFADFKKTMEIRADNSNNTVFADDKGNIAYWHGNFMPKRDPQFDYSQPVDGSISATNWKGVHALGETVHVYNPATGWIENCNSTPFTVSGTSSPKKEDYPLYMAPDGQNYRAINAMRLLNNAHDLTIDKLIHDIGYSHYLSAFEVLIPPLIEAWDKLPVTDSLKQLLQAPVDSLRQWDKNSSVLSVATTVAIEWGYRMLQKASPLGPYQVSDAVLQMSTAINNTSPSEKLNLLMETINDLQKRFRTWKIPWGDVNRYQRTGEDDEKFADNKPSFPVGLAAATWGSIPSFATRRFPNNNKRYGLSGNSFIACVEFVRKDSFGGKKVKAKTVTTGGQSFDPASPHFTDQAEMYINGNFKDVLFYKEDLMKHVERAYHPGE